MALIAIVGKGAFSYDSLKQKSPRELVRIQKTLDKYFKEKAKAMNSKGKKSSDSLVSQ